MKTVLTSPDLFKPIIIDGLSQGEIYALTHSLAIAEYSLQLKDSTSNNEWLGFIPVKAREGLTVIGYCARRNPVSDDWVCHDVCKQDKQGQIELYFCSGFYSTKEKVIAKMYARAESDKFGLSPISQEYWEFDFKLFPTFNLDPKETEYEEAEMRSLLNYVDWNLGIDTEELVFDFYQMTRFHPEQVEFIVAGSTTIKAKTEKEARELLEEGLSSISWTSDIESDYEECTEYEILN